MNNHTFEERIEELEYTEEWKTLAEGIQYRRVGTDVELKVALWVDTLLQSWRLKELGQLSSEYRPLVQLGIPVAAKILSTDTVTNVILEIHTDGKIGIQNILNHNITVHPILRVCKIQGIIKII